MQISEQTRVKLFNIGLLNLVSSPEILNEFMFFCGEFTTHEMKRRFWRHTLTQGISSHGFPDGAVGLSEALGRFSSNALI